MAERSGIVENKICKTNHLREYASQHRQITSAELFGSAWELAFSKLNFAYYHMPNILVESELTG